MVDSIEPGTSWTWWPRIGCNGIFGTNRRTGIEAVAKQGGIHAEGDISGFAEIAYAGHDIDRVLDGAQLIYVVGPAFSTEPFGEAVAGKLKVGQTVIVSPGSCGGALIFKRAAGIAVDDDSIRSPRC